MKKTDKIKAKVTVVVDMILDQESYDFLKESIDEGDIQAVNEMCDFDCEGKFTLEKVHEGT